MSTKLKVHGGTRSSHAPRLCDTCQSGVVTKGAADSDEHVHCMITEKRVHSTVVECNRYVDQSRPSIWDMRQIAWILQTDPRRQKIGFVRAKEWEREHKDEQMIPSCPD